MRSFVAGALTLSCVLAAAASRAQGIKIDHQGVGCVVAGRYPTLETRFRRASAVGRAEVLFRARGATD